ncbi:MAG: 6-phosphogluconolactonase [Phycisphaerae bacterium]|nr:6-phosphogluconolactonase [Phycisphaerae bacterium]MDW8261497.1 6-phosphogluconolactonase [Phycisphaerales bacterium]
MAGCEIRVFADQRAMVEEAASRIVAAARRAHDAGRLFTLFLSGGSTPRALYQLLASEPWKPRIDWRNVGLYFGDERCVPPDSPHSNWRMAQETLIREIPIPSNQVYRMKGEIDPQLAAKEYGKMLKEHFDSGGADLMLLGMGIDGHTASLFPGTSAVREADHRCVANRIPDDYNLSPIPPGTHWRITVTFPFINRSGEVLILCAGADKSETVKAVLEGPHDPDRLPIQRVNPAAGGNLSWFLDAAAARGLSRR